MDSLIRLDTILPITPLPESRPSMNIGSPGIDNLQNTNLHQTGIDADSLADIDVIPVIDITHDEELPIPDTAIRSIDSSNPPIITLDESVGTTSGAMPQTPNTPVITLDQAVATTSGAKRQTPAKHKLPLLSNHNPPKIPRITGGDLDFTILNSSGIFQNVNRPTSSLELSHTVTAPALMKNHTVTSADFNDDLQVDPIPLNLSGTSRETNKLMTCANRQNNSEIIPGHSLALNEFSFPDNNLRSYNNPFPNTFTVNNRPIQFNQGDKNIAEVGNDSGKNREKESVIFCQILDIFPDIDLTFLENQCRSGLNINQISEIILEMNDYPKAVFQTCETIPPKVVVNDNVTNNFKVSPSCSSSTDPPILADEIITEVYDKKLNDNSSLVGLPETDTTSVTVGNPTNVNQNATTSQISDKKKDEIVGLAPIEVQEENRIAVGEDKRDNGLLKEEIKDISETTIFQSNYSFLMEVFPDADPSYLELKSKLNENDLRTFIAESVKKHDYPKVTNCPVKNEIEASDEFGDVGLYTTNFNIENFIKIFPEPFEYFLDEKRNHQFSDHGIEFLKRRYRTHSLKLIMLKYKEYNFNLVKTCTFLEAEKPSRVSKRSLKEIKMPDKTNLPFLQEACFIEHKSEIRNYLDSIAEVKRLAYDQAQAKGELIECGCCYSDVLFENCAACNEGHLFCKDCIRKSVEVRVGDAHTTFPCLIDCGSVFSLRLLEVLVHPTMFSRLLQRIQMDEVKAADIEGLECCPFCDFAIILPPETNIFKCLNPECLKESCRKCHKLSHIPQRCEEVENDDQARARKYIEDEMTRALVRECYKCKKSFIKTDGCNKMTCTCGAKMCYICRQPVVDYKHFNGPGGEKNKRCPLYSTEKLLHVDAVEAVAKKALDEVTSKNPELKLKHDPTKMLPSAASVNTTLPPGVNEGAERLNELLQFMEWNGQGQQNGPFMPVPVINEAVVRPYQGVRVNVRPIVNQFLLNNPRETWEAPPHFGVIRQHLDPQNNVRNWIPPAPPLLMEAEANYLPQNYQRINLPVRLISARNRQQPPPNNQPQ